jgi:hypothetical protein
MLALGQPSGRFFLEPYLWAGAAFVTAPADLWKPRMIGALTAQTTIVAAAAIAGAAMLFPGALTRDLRVATMAKAANGHEEAAWLDRVAPKDSTLLAFTRSHALVPRRFVSGERVRSASQLGDAILAGHVDTVVAPPDGTILREIRARCGAQEIGAGTFREAMRNPFHRGAEYRLVAVRLESPGDCARQLRDGSMGLRGGW